MRLKSICLLLLLGVLVIHTHGAKPKGKTMPPPVPPNPKSTPPQAAPSKGRSVAAKGRSMEKPIDLDTPRPPTEEEAKKFVEELEPDINDKCYKRTKTEWDYVTNLTPENEAKTVKETLEFSTYRRRYWKQFVSFPWKDFKDPTLKRQFLLESVLGTDILSEEKIKDLTMTINSMKQMYSTAKICDFKNKTQCDLSLDPDITAIMAKSRDFDELQHLWLEWRSASSKNMAPSFTKYVELGNEAAVLNEFHDFGDLWRRPYQSDFIHLEVWSLWGQIRPLYEQVHAYARKKLRDFYKKDSITKDGPIPAHLFGNMWAQNWANIYQDILAPYKDAPNMDVTDALIAKNYTVLQMFKQSDEFFQSLGLLPMTPGFWKETIMERPPPPREIVCHPEAWDMCNKQDYYIKQCSVVSMRDFITIHHEMGHIQYYMQYKDQLNSFREGANPGFHEAIGDTIAMSVSSPKHLKEIGLLDNYEDNEKNTINFLFSQALKILVDIPWDIVLEQWRWDVFSGRVKPADYNCHWWKLRTQIQGIKPPVCRSSKDFDPGAKFHVPSSVPYDRYFFARILTYQFHEALCKEAGQFDPADPTKPLHQCDIYKSTAAGSKLSSMLKLGSSKPWPEAMSLVTGTRRLDARPVINYYAPLIKWLEAENAKTNEFIGWVDGDMDHFCKKE